MLYLFTFCVDLNKYDKDSLKSVLNVLINSLEDTNPIFKLIIFTNFDFKVDNKKIELRKYYDNGIKYFNNNIIPKSKDNGFSIDWRNLSFNKINVWKDLYEETKKNYTWVDLDTIFVHDIANNVSKTICVFQILFFVSMWRVPFCFMNVLLAMDALPNIQKTQCV